jgi:hypothetical protein
MNKGDDKCIQYLCGKTLERDHFGDKSISGFETKTGLGETGLDSAGSR